MNRQKSKRSSARSKVETIGKQVNQESKEDSAPLRGQTKNQKAYMAAIDSSPITLALGPAGTGKTYIATTMASDMLMNQQIGKILITRPAMEAGERLGFLPGDIGEKFDPYFAPVREILNRRLGTAYVESLIKSGKITTMPLAYMRGHTFNNTFMILDEAQNASPEQVKLFLTRVGTYSKIVISGDISQKDLKSHDGLSDAMRRLEPFEVASMVEFTREDVVRSGLAKVIVEAYEN
mgnify:CR=1 FL=1|tara:strand:+ start:604 stop:1311 length:708 start_codon:yes stop_codon:yes gene_type:complete